jgi:hypothetical protein
MPTLVGMPVGTVTLGFALVVVRASVGTTSAAARIEARNAAASAPPARRVLSLNADLLWPCRWQEAAATRPFALGSSHND